MSDILGLFVEWGPIVRMKLGVDIHDLPDVSLNNAILVAMSEDRIKRLLPDWEDLQTDHDLLIRMAGISMYTSQWTDWCKTNVYREQREGFFGTKIDPVDWDQRKADLIGEAFSYLGAVDSTIDLSSRYIEIARPDPLFTEV